MGNTVNRDRLRGMLSELQTMTGKRVSATRHLMSKRDCYNAIYELMKLELGINTKKENETLKRLNKTLNEVNCEVNQDREELRKSILKHSAKEELLKNDNYFLNKRIKSLQLSLNNYKNDFDMQVLKNEKLEKELFKSKIINRVCYVGLAFIMGVSLWGFFVQ